MGQLKPGATYIYERNKETVYAREFGADPMTRQVVGWEYNKDKPNFDPRTSDGRPLYEQLQESKMWGEIHRMAKTNVTLQKALEQCIIIYNLSKDHGP
jgi:hypothetical protein